jgi:hypothetical protein
MPGTTIRLNKRLLEIGLARPGGGSDSARYVPIVVITTNLLTGFFLIRKKKIVSKPSSGNAEYSGAL